MATAPCGAGVTTTKPCVEDPASQTGQNFADVDLIRLPRQGVPARLTPQGDDVASTPQGAEQFRHIGSGNPLGFGDLGDGKRGPRLRASEGKHASEAVFFLGR